MLVLPTNLGPSVSSLSYLLPGLTPSSTVTAMGATALVPLVISLTLLSKKALDLAGKEEENLEKVNIIHNGKVRYILCLAFPIWNIATWKTYSAFGHKEQRETFSKQKEESPDNSAWRFKEKKEKLF